MESVNGSFTRPIAGPKIIVIGNTKGGTGKSTVCMHIIVSLLHKNYKIGSLDLDARQGTLSRYIANREIKKNNNPDFKIPTSYHQKVFQSKTKDTIVANHEELKDLKDAIENAKEYDFLIIDTPGSENFLSISAHSFADILITPINDSFIDLDLLVRLNDEMTVLKPSIYAEMVWEQRKQRLLNDNKKLRWIVLRNRITPTNKEKDLVKILESLSKRYCFQCLAGFSDRTIFKELFLSGLTLLDLRTNNLPIGLSHIAAKQELTRLTNAVLEDDQKEEIFFCKPSSPFIKEKCSIKKSLGEKIKALIFSSV